MHESNLLHLTLNIYYSHIMKRIAALQTCLTVMALLVSASASLAAECADDPNESTLKKLCEVATTIDGATPFYPPVIRVEVKA